MRIPRRSFTSGLGALAVTPAAAAAPPRITVGYTATLGFNGAFIAKDRGFFAQRGLDVELMLIALNSTIPGALTGGSIQIGGPTPTVLLQANDGGLDLVVVAGCSGVDPGNVTDGLMVRRGVAITQASDCIGKKIGVPGLNAIYHVLVRKWLDDHGVDWRRVNFVEVAFSQSADVLRSGSVDAVATGQPFSQRILSDGIGALVVSYAEIAPSGPPAIFYAAARDWADGHRDAVHAFRLALADAIQFQASDPASARVSASRFMKLPAEAMAATSLPLLQAEASPDQMRFWIDVMAKQGMLQEKPDLSSLPIPVNLC